MPEIQAHLFELCVCCIVILKISVLMYKPSCRAVKCDEHESRYACFQKARCGHGFILSEAVKERRKKKRNYFRGKVSKRKRKENTILD